MYCYKCGAHCKNRATYCRKCNGPLLSTQGEGDAKHVTPEALANYHRALKEQRLTDLSPLFPESDLSHGEKLSPELLHSFHQKCLDKAEESYQREVANTEAFYAPKLEKTKGREHEQEEESYRGALAQAKQNRDLSMAALGKEEKAHRAIDTIHRAALEADAVLPALDDSTNAHSFAQYLHKRADNSKDRAEAGGCFLVLGLILLIVGLLFFFLSFKTSPDYTITYKILKFDSFEFVVFCAGVGIGGAMLIAGITMVLTAVKTIRAMRNALNYFGVYYRL